MKKYLFFASYIVLLAPSCIPHQTVDDQDMFSSTERTVISTEKTPSKKQQKATKPLEENYAKWLDVDIPFLETDELFLAKIMPEVTIEDVKNNTGFEIIFFNSGPELVLQPTTSEINLLNNQIDPMGVYLKH